MGTLEGLNEPFFRRQVFVSIARIKIELLLLMMILFV
jgi:hypothetical protein